MNRQNVVPFATPARGAWARRGAPDKTRPREVDPTVEIDCPWCMAVLCVEAGVLATDPEILCAGCDRTFSPLPGKAAAD